MPAFTYTALDASGNTVTGNLAVRNKMDVYRELEKKSLHPVSVKEEAAEAKAGKRSESETPGAGPVRLKRGQVILFTEELADMLDAGLQLEQALRVLHDRQEDPSIRRVSAKLRDDIREGAKFSASLKKASPSFDELYVNLIAAGEASGSLADILRRLAWNLQVMNDLQSRVISALVYPAFLIGACALLLFVFGTVLMPQLTDLITSSNQRLPLLTRILVAFSDFLAAWWWAILAVVVASFLIFRAIIATKGGTRLVGSISTRNSADRARPQRQVLRAILSIPGKSGQQRRSVAQRPQTDGPGHYERLFARQTEPSGGFSGRRRCPLDRDAKNWQLSQPHDRYARRGRTDWPTRKKPAKIRNAL